MSQTVTEIGDSVTKQSIEAIDRLSQELIERLTVDTAENVAHFLHDRDRDILVAANLPRTERSYRNFLNHYQLPLTRHAPWSLSKDKNRWEAQIKTPSPQVHRRATLAENATNFHYHPPETISAKINAPLYLEMTFLDLKGQEQFKVTNTPLLPSRLRDVSRKENTWLKAESYFERLIKLKPGEVDVSRVIGAYVPSKVIGPYTPASAEKAGIPFAPEKSAYAGKENPKGKRFQGIVRWSTPVVENGKITGYVTLALDHSHIMEFTDHIVPTGERHSDISDPGSGNYAFMWDYEGRNISHPRDYFIVGIDPETGEQAVPWLSAQLYQKWQKSGLNHIPFLQSTPSYLEQSRNKKPSLELRNQGMLALDCRYLNFAPQCSGWQNITAEGGSGSFLIFWSDLWKITTAATIPYFTGQYGDSPRGFGWVTIGANVKEFHRPALRTKEEIDEKILQSDQQITELNQSILEVIQSSKKDLVTKLGTYTLIMIVLVILLAIWLATILTRRISTLVTGLHNFQLGDLETRFNNENNDEIGQLADAFNDMADRIQVGFQLLQEEIEERRFTEKALKHSRDHLDERVQERTEELMIAKEMAEEASIAKTDFLANMSHELRTPLNVIIGFSDVIARQMMGPVDNKKYLEYIEDILNSSYHLLGLINDILDVAKAESGTLVINNTETELNTLVSSCVHMLDEVAKNNNLVITGNYFDKPLDLYLDELRLRQVVINVLNNSIKYTPQGGTIKVSTRLNKEQHFVITVEDNGIGIDHEDIHRIFEPFGQVDSAYTRSIEGVGLGLPLSKKLIEAQGGTIMLESTKGKGTKVSIILPADLALKAPRSEKMKEKAV
ncbi:sensor histidine kinase [Kiloniella sp.]|uniref:sensor histidine kinase n=1 Tax=Kiloniella sp. TaxID=1938587 RepID=UPI003B014445